MFRGTNSPHCLAWPTCKFEIGDVYSKSLGEWKSLGLIISPIIQPGFFFSILGRGPRVFQIGKISAVNH